MVQPEQNKSVQRLVIISNRLPIVLEKNESGVKITLGSGGLVTALAPVLRNRGGVWIGWAGNYEPLNEDEMRHLTENAKELTGYSCSFVPLSKEEIDLYYQGFSNEIIWPLFHDLQSMCNFDPTYWYEYQKVNKKFAEITLQHIAETDFVWVHDYQLMLVGQELRKSNKYLHLAFFLHIPFPPLDIFLKLPWRFQIIRALLEYDVVGFQTMRDKKNFVQCVKALLPDVFLEEVDSLHVCKIGERKSCIGAFPISIDYDDFVTFAKSSEVADAAWHIHEGFKEQTLILSIDRLDYTKGIPYRLEAFRNLLRRFPEVHERVTLIQVIIPSRVDIPRYNQLKDDINRLISEINSEFTQNGWVPIHYLFRSLSRTELVAYYRTCEIALVTSLKDGMNLVAKEYVACDLEHRGVLILSEFAGAAAQLQDYVLLVNPYDIEGVAEAIHRAILMPDEERTNNMMHMQENISRYNIFWWLERFLEVAVNKKLKDFPLVKEFIPKEFGS